MYKIYRALVIRFCSNTPKQIKLMTVSLNFHVWHYSFTFRKTLLGQLTLVQPFSSPPPSQGPSLLKYKQNIGGKMKFRKEIWYSSGKNTKIFWERMSPDYTYDTTPGFMSRTTICIWLHGVVDGNYWIEWDANILIWSLSVDSLPPPFPLTNS
jgi:hypothetical protein